MDPDLSLQEKGEWMRHGLKVVLAGLLLVLSTEGAWAQIVNTQPLLDKSEKKGFAAEFTGTMDWRTGNTTLIQLGGNLFLTGKFRRNRIISSSSIEWGMKNDVNFLNSMFTHLRHQYKITSWLTSEVFGQVSKNQFMRVNLRVLGGVGPRFEIVNTDPFRLAVGVAYMFEHEEVDTADSNTNDTHQTHRMSSYLSVSWKLDENLSVGSSTFFQPAVTNFQDYRVANDESLTVSVTDHLAVSLSFQLWYDSRAPASVESLDTVTLGKLTVGF